MADIKLGFQREVLLERRKSEVFFQRDAHSQQGPRGQPPAQRRPACA
jgi:hypothetical protein